MPCSDHAVLLKATAQHGRRETVCGLSARVRLLPATTRSSTKIIRSIPILFTTIHTYDCKVWYQHTTKKTICSTVGLAVRIFPATTRTFTKDTALSEQGRGAAWHVWINALPGRGTAWARHAMCESALIMPADGRWDFTRHLKSQRSRCTSLITVETSRNMSVQERADTC